MFASTASGGWPGASAQVQVALRTVVERRPLEEAMDFARLYSPGTEQVQVEEAIQGPLPGLAARGYSQSVVTNSWPGERDLLPGRPVRERRGLSVPRRPARRRLRRGSVAMKFVKVARRGGIPPFIVMDVMRAANARDRRRRGRRRCVHLEVGQPGTPAPRAVRRGGARARSTASALGYTDGARHPAAARAHRPALSRACTASRVDPSASSSRPARPAHSCSASSPPSIPATAWRSRRPGYPAYRNILTALGIEPVGSCVGDRTTRFQPTPALLDRVAATHRRPDRRQPGQSDRQHDRGRATSRRWPTWCRARGIRLVSDEIYHGITYGMRAATALAFSDEAIVINSFSKYFSMTGWRLGWMVVPPDLLRAVECWRRTCSSRRRPCRSSPPSRRSTAGDELDGNVARYRANRDLLLKALPEAGFTRFAPADGAFYLYADVAHMTNDSDEFCRRMLAETGVATTPGIDFDPGRGRAFVRFSFAGTTEDMHEAARRLKAWRR